MSRCYHENTSWRKFRRMGGAIGFAHQCADCLRKVGGYREAWDLPERLDPASVPWAKKREGATGLGGRGNSSRRARDDFRRSAAWRRQRARVLERDGYSCRLYLEGCTEKATEAHHKSYADPIEKTPDSEIIAVCTECHRLHHERTRFED